MLEAKKASVWKNRYDITSDGRRPATWDGSSWKSGGTFELDARHYEVRANMWGNKYGSSPCGIRPRPRVPQQGKPAGGSGFAFVVEDSCGKVVLRDCGLIAQRSFVFDTLAIVCGPNTYRFTGGFLNVLAREPGVAAHLTLDHVTAEDQTGKTVRVVGAETYNDALNRLTSKVMFFSQDGGKVDSVNNVYRAWSNGHIVFFDFGTCVF